MENFRTKLRNLRKQRPGVISASQQNIINQAVKSLLTQSAMGSTGMSFGPSGMHIAASQKQSIGVSRFGVVRDIGTGEEHFLQVQEIEQSDTSPWDGQWQFNPNGVAEPVNTYPTLKSKDYTQFVYQGSVVDSFVPVIEIRKIDRQWFAFQTIIYRLPLQETNPILRWTDCTPREDLP